MKIIDSFCISFGNRISEKTYFLKTVEHGWFAGVVVQEGRLVSEYPSNPGITFGEWIDHKFEWTQVQGDPRVEIVKICSDEIRSIPKIFYHTVCGALRRFKKTL
ncbi:hypothetical protein QO009_003102 [Brevibacillus aydinogluensis]|uniref:hypothetical protein n=1 Tax=Brevibacillus aydinogluensis TaxID=927786 RepID=UPI002892DEDA|nr:hypothetical protein [Brevibacillus aydinogluensis]MDT3417207.1 hypothetical protein [Brevibacillus aydinogluensis]